MLIDPDGADAQNTLEDGVATLDGPSLGSVGSLLYDYTGGFYFEYPEDAGNYPAAFGLVVGGIVTQPQDMPTSRIAIYGGDALGTYETIAQTVTLENGVSVVTANFRAGGVDVTMDGFAASDADTLAPIAAPLVNEITVKGMVINGNQFSGGTMETLVDGTPVVLTGTGTNTSAEGMFFGYSDVRGGPAEVGGIAVTEDGTSAVLGLFIAK